MTMFTTTTDVSGITPDDFGELIVQPVQKQSVAFRAGTVVETDSTRMNFPVVTDDPSAAWVKEGDDITLSDATLDEVTVTPSKVAGLTKLSNELANDSSPRAQEIVGHGVARDIITKVDAAFFGDTVTNGPSGLQSISYSTIDTGSSSTAIANLDDFAEAISKAQEKGVDDGGLLFVTSPAKLLTLRQLKQGTDSNVPLLQGSDSTGGTGASQDSILGVPVVASSGVDSDTDAWLIPKSVVMVVQRSGAQLAVDSSRYFESDSLAVRATMRVGFGFVYESAVVRLYDAA